MVAGSVFGICGLQANALTCLGEPHPDIAPIVYCGLTQVDRTPVLTEGLTLADPSGIPGRNCVEIQIDPELDYYDVNVTTCSLWLPELEYIMGDSDLIIDPVTELPIGTKGATAASQFCVCSGGQDDCKVRVALMVWSMNFCPGADNFTQNHPAGKYMLTVYPAVQFRATTTAVTINSSLNGRQYTGRAYPNPTFAAGPGMIIPEWEAEDLDRPWYTFPTDVPPPGGCTCGSCEDEDEPEPYEFNVPAAA